MPTEEAGNPPPTSRVSKSANPPRKRARVASARRTASRQASIAPSCEPTWTRRPRHLSGPPRPPPAAIAAASSSGASPNLLAPRPTARPRWVSGETSGLRRRRTSRRESEPGPEPSRAPELRASRASTAASSTDSRATQRRGCRSAAARTAARSTASVLPIPSSVMRSSGSPARRARCHSPAETTLAPKPWPASEATTAGRSFALSEYWWSQGAGKAARSSSAASSTAAMSVK